MKFDEFYLNFQRPCMQFNLSKEMAAKAGRIRSAEHRSARIVGGLAEQCSALQFVRDFCRSPTVNPDQYTRTMATDFWTVSTAEVPASTGLFAASLICVNGLKKLRNNRPLTA